MHQLGTHSKVEVVSSGQDPITVHDADYDFETQEIHPVTPTDFGVGDRIEVTCGYMNTTGGIVGFGEGSDDEMCFAGVYYYPAVGAPYLCSDDISI